MDENKVMELVGVIQASAKIMKCAAELQVKLELAEMDDYAPTSVTYRMKDVIKSAVRELVPAVGLVLQQEQV